MSVVAALRRRRRELSTGWRLCRTRRAWQRSRSAPVAAQSALPVRRLLLLPSDPNSLVGARGDEAMMESVVTALRRAAPDLTVAVAVASDRAADAAAALGHEPIRVWHAPLPLDAQRRAVAAFAPDAVVVLGADVMDGYYSVAHPTRALILADVLARAGARVSVLGYSFNARPAPAMRAVFDGLSPRVRLHVRDPLSLERFRSFCSADATLVADAAFLLDADRNDPRARALADWADSRRAAGERVLAFNVHPMLVKSATDADVDRLIAAAATALQRVADERPVSWLLLPHDYRGVNGDDRCLAPLAARLAALGPRVRHPAEPLSAAALKAVAGACDGVVTGRMHLAIAALGQGRPVAGLTYQDKFHGLFCHFDLPTEFLMPPSLVVDAGVLTARLLAFDAQAAALQSVVRDRLPQVVALARENLRELLPEAAG